MGNTRFVDRNTDVPFGKSSLMVSIVWCMALIPVRSPVEGAFLRLVVPWLLVGARHSIVWGFLQSQCTFVGSQNMKQSQRICPFWAKNLIQEWEPMENSVHKISSSIWRMDWPEANGGEVPCWGLVGFSPISLHRPFFQCL